MSYTARRSERNITVRVRNLDTGREDVHRGLSMDEVEWIKLTPTVEVEILEVSMRGRSRRTNEE